MIFMSLFLASVLRASEGIEEKQAKKNLLARFDNVLTEFSKSGNAEEDTVLKSEAYHDIREFQAQRVLKPLMFSKAICKRCKIKPSTGIAGQITGDEFPRRTWAVTFDDGPLSDGGVTASIVDEIFNRGIWATFFMVAEMLDADVATAQYVRDHGMTIGDHSYTHAHLEDPVVDADHEIAGAKSDIETKLKIPVTLFRFPYGEGQDNLALRKKIADLRMVSVLWNVDSLDWADSDPTSIYKRTVTQVESRGNRGGIILFHDIHPPTLQAAARVMDYLKAKRMKICTVDRVITQINSGKKCER